MRTGTIILIPFPFSELSDVKVRPAVVIALTRDKFRDVLLAAISSQIPKTTSINDKLIKAQPNNGLRVNSIIKVDRVCTLKKEKIIATLGELSALETEEFIKVFKSLVD